MANERNFLVVVLDLDLGDGSRVHRSQAWSMGRKYERATRSVHLSVGATEVNDRG